MQSITLPENIFFIVIEYGIFGEGSQIFTMRTWPVARSIFDAPYVREANERATSWITQISTTRSQEREGTVFSLLIGHNLRPLIPKNTLSDVVRPSIRRESLRFKIAGGCARRTRKYRILLGLAKTRSLSPERHNIIYNIEY